MVSNKHRRTLSAVFKTPAPADLRWNTVETMLKSLGASIEERAGSAVMIELSGARLSLHKPHPQPEMKKHAVRTLRDFLKKNGITP